jgi:small subunit ribosomal protein S4
VIIIGDPRRLKKKFKKPKHPFQRERLKEELEFIGKYGLRNKREFWKMRTIVGNWRDIARKSRTLPRDQMIEVQQTLLRKLSKLGILGSDAEFEDLLKRRLQTLVFEKGFAQTIYQARQLVVHGHIQIKGKKINAPSYIVKQKEEDFVGITAKSSISAVKQAA